MMLKFERGIKLLPKQLLCCLSLQNDLAGTSALPSTPRIESPGIHISGVNSTSMNVAFHWNGFLCAALSKTEHFVSAFEHFNIAAYLRGTSLTSHQHSRPLAGSESH